MAEPLDVLIRAIAKPTSKNVASALSHPDLGAVLKGLSKEDFRVLADLIRRYIALARAPRAIRAGDAEVLRSLTKAGVDKSVCDV